MSLLTQFLTRRGAGPAPEPDIDEEDLALYPPPELPGGYPYVPVLCDVPTPADHSDSTCHPSVVDTGKGGWNGYRWWMANTPYPPERDENPIILGSNDRINWEEPRPGMNPIEDSPTKWGWPVGYHADTELWFDGEKLHCWWNTVLDLQAGIDETHYSSSTNGTDWATPEKLFDGLFGLSPMVTGLGTVWIMYSSNRRWAAPSPKGPWAPTHTMSFPSPGAMRHGDIIYHDGLWWGIGSNPAQPAHARVSRDGINWSGGSAPLIEGDWVTGTYRPTMLPSNVPGYMDVWVSVNGGPTLYTTAYTRIPKSVWTDLL